METTKELTIAMKESSKVFGEKIKELGIIEDVIELANSKDNKEFYELFDSFIALEVLKCYENDEYRQLASHFEKIMDIGINLLSEEE